MKKTLSILLLSMLLPLVMYSDWHETWLEAVKNCKEKDYENAEKNFTLTIKYLEETSDDDHMHVYVDRARLYEIQKRFSESLIDVNKALASPKLVGTDRIRALMTRLTDHANLGMENEMMKDYEEFKSLNPYKPTNEFLKDRIIIRNVPDCECYLKIIKYYLIESGYCDEDDIQLLPGRTLVAKKKKNSCECGCDKSKIKSEDTLHILPPKDKRPLTQDEIDKKLEEQIAGCKWWCERAYTGAVTFCGNKFVSWFCKAACITSADFARDKCLSCCSTGDFYTSCIKPFDDILKNFPNDICTPDWN